MIDENNNNTTHEYINNYTITHKEIIKGYITASIVEDSGFYPCVCIKILLEDESNIE